MMFRVRHARDWGGEGTLREFKTIEDLQALALEEKHDILLELPDENDKEQLWSIRIYDDYFE